MEVTFIPPILEIKPLTYKTPGSMSAQTHTQPNVSKMYLRSH